MPDGVRNRHIGCLPSEASPLIHQYSLATENKQCKVVKSVLVPSNKRSFDGHARVPI